ncbi:NAD(P)-dependent oxidoreductase [Lentisalinibacter sediminis]|uniref:NAD(P)-dependent oxidoreductase n=1 Tax=Lentisalinibacter sediminis TaxID=2992237 RepID=UPI0038647890
MRIAFIGLGVMGFPMAGHLSRAGHDVAVYNRTPGKSRHWCETHTGRSAATPAQAARGVDIAFTCVGNDDDVRAVVLGEDGVLAGLGEGGILVDHTTASAAMARELAAAAGDAGAGFLDAPVSGGQAGAEHGTLTVMAGGDPAVYERAEPVIDIYARRCRLMGPAGSGQLTKMVNQICIAGLLQGLAEGLDFARRANLDGRAVVEAISQGAAQSWQMDNRHETMLDGEFDFGFAVEWMRKDLGIALDEARRNGASLPVAALVDQFYAEVEAMGGRRWDTSSLIARLADTTEA